MSSGTRFVTLATNSIIQSAITMCAWPPPIIRPAAIWLWLKKKFLKVAPLTPGINKYRNWPYRAGPEFRRNYGRRGQRRTTATVTFPGAAGTALPACLFVVPPLPSMMPACLPMAHAAASMHPPWLLASPARWPLDDDSDDLARSYLTAAKWCVHVAGITTLVLLVPYHGAVQTCSGVHCPCTPPLFIIVSPSRCEKDMVYRCHSYLSSWALHLHATTKGGLGLACNRRLSVKRPFFSSFGDSITFCKKNLELNKASQLHQNVLGTDRKVQCMWFLWSLSQEVGCMHFGSSVFQNRLYLCVHTDSHTLENAWAGFSSGWHVACRVLFTNQIIVFLRAYSSTHVWIIRSNHWSGRFSVQCPVGSWCDVMSDVISRWRLTNCSGHACPHACM